MKCLIHGYPKMKITLKKKQVNVWLAILIAITPFSQTYSEFNYAGLIDTRIVSTNNNTTSWLNGGLSPLRFDRTDSSIILGQGLFSASLQATDNLEINSVVSAYNDDAQTFGVNEIYVHYRPAPNSAYRFDTKAGIFFPEFSLENIRPGWTSSIPLSNSAINTWIGEEIRVYGIQTSLTHLGRARHSIYDYGATLGIFGNNDPTGAMLAWRGWAIHDRQVRAEEKIAIYPRTALNIDSGFVEQSPYFDPFLETDDTLGYYLSLFLHKKKKIKIKYTYYDNRAAPESQRQGQYGWHTQFSHISASYTLRKTTRLFSQWLSGSTRMGVIQDNLYVSADIGSWYIGINERFKKLQFSVRYDKFWVTDKDTTFIDNNNQDGQAWVVALRYNVNRSFALIAEHLYLKENRPVLVEQQASPEANNVSTQLALQWRF